MNTPKHFLDRPQRRTYQLQGINIELDLPPEVFPPSTFVVPFAELIKINPGDRVADIGTGSGILAIMATKLGAEVLATDISPHSVLNAHHNAALNKVAINLKEGSFFAGTKEKFDVIIANLPQEILPGEFEQTLGTELTQTISGGMAGNEILLEFLKEVPKHMHAYSRLYINVGTLSDYKNTFRFIAENFDARLINTYALPTKAFVKNHIDFYKKLNKQGKIHIFNEEDSWKAMIYPFELKLKSEEE